MQDFRHTRRWKAVRARVLAGKPTLCGICLGAKGPIRYDVSHHHPLSAVVDHIQPVVTVNHLSESEREAFFLDIRNLQPAHKTCNDAKKDSFQRKPLPNPGQEW